VGKLLKCSCGGDVGDQIREKEGHGAGRGIWSKRFEKRRLPMVEVAGNLCLNFD
jgi:hypothetical protein